MSSPRLLVGAAFALASAALPATASATLKRVDVAPMPSSASYGFYTDNDNNQQPKWTDDGILNPGESVNVDFPLGDDTVAGPATEGSPTGQLFDNESTGGSLTITRPSGNGSPYLRTFNGSGNSFINDESYRLTLNNGLVCGTNVPLRLSFGALGPLDILYGLPTGATGAYQSTESYDIGNVIGDGGTKDSQVQVTQAGLNRGIRIHINMLEHHYSTRWLKIRLVSPSGKSAMLFDEVGQTDDGVHTPTKTLDNVTFSDTPVNGVSPVDASVAEQQNFKDQVISPVDSFSVFDGETIAGNWHLVVSDVAVPADSRTINRRGRSASFGTTDMFQLGSWQFQSGAAVCNTTLPQAWLDTPLYADPAGDTLDASGSYPTVPGRKITQYRWDLDTTNDSPAVTFEQVTSTPTLTLPPKAADTGVPIKLQVFDGTDASALLSRTLVTTKKPVFTAPDVTPTSPQPTPGNMISVNPATPQAGDTITLTAKATDAESTQGQITYAWDLNDDGVFSEGSAATATISWNDSGAHIVRVKATDAQGASTIYYQTISIANLPPTASFKFGPSPAVIGQPMSFDATASTDSDGSIVEYAWDFDNDNAFEVTSKTPVVAYTYLQAGNKSVHLRTTDNQGSSTISEVADFHVTGPPVGAITASNSTPATGETVSFSASGSHDTDPSGSIAKYEWDLDGNGSWDVIGATAATATRAYPNPGNVSVRLRVTDNDGATSTTSISLLVKAPAAGTGTGTGTGPVPATTPKPAGNTGGGGGGGGAVTTNPVTNNQLFPNVAADEPTVGASTSRDGGVTGGSTPDSLAVSPKGFIASLATGAKQHAKKTFKKGIAVNYKANTAGTVTVQLMVLPKYAKKVGLKLKGTKLVKIGAGKVVAKKAGTYKFIVVVAKKYQRYVKKATKMPVELRAVATSKETSEQLVIGKKFTYVK